jgi:hypothetical protein
MYMYLIDNDVFNCIAYGANFATWGLRFIAALAVRDQVYNCSPNPADLELTAIPAGYTLCPIQPGLPPGLKCFIQCGKDLLNSSGVEYDDKWIGFSIMILWCFFIACFTAGYLATRYINHVKR